ncbi:MAG: hypothetical protein ACJAYS_000606, partial [Lentimonas sp.]
MALRNTEQTNPNAGAMLTDILSEVRPERVSVPDFGPRILRFTDGVSETSNSQMTPGGVFSIIGE